MSRFRMSRRSSNRSFKKGRRIPVYGNRPRPGNRGGVRL